jgi:uncharacterized protein YbjT (DUF2867 family)
MILVVGATGTTGSHLVRELVAARVPVRALCRDVARARALLPPQVQLVAGDLERPETLPAALAGVTSVYVALTASPTAVTSENALVDAARAAGVRHLVKLSGVDVSLTAPARVQRMHAQIEQHLQASGIPFTILRANFFMQNFLGMAPAISAGAFHAPTGPGRAALVDARDLASAAARVLTSGGHEGRIYTLTGPQALSHGEAAAILGQLVGHRVDFVDVPVAAFIAGGVQAGLSPWFAETLADVYATVFAVDGCAQVTADIERITGRKPRPLADFVRDHKTAFTAAA